MRIPFQVTSKRVENTDHAKLKLFLLVKRQSPVVNDLSGRTKEDIEKIEDLTILAESEEAGVFLVIAKDGRQIFVMGHPEYDRYTLHNEYKRDKEKGLPIEMPVNYYPDNDDTRRPSLQWRSHGNILYSNWLNYYVYQTTPYSFINTAEIIGK